MAGPNLAHLPRPRSLPPRHLGARGGETPHHLARAPSISRSVGTEARKSYAQKLRSGFIEAYLGGERVLDIGYKGYGEDAVPIVPQAIGVDLDYPGYDGRRLPFADGSQDAVYSSHCLEHITDHAGALQDWFRTLRVGGFLIIAVPHQFLYERKLGLPSIWNADHKRFYTPAALLQEVEQALAPNSYRVRHLADNDRDYDYGILPDRHAGGCYEIELVLEKIRQPEWRFLGEAEMAEIEARRIAAADPDQAWAGTGATAMVRGLAKLRRRIAPPGSARERAARAVYTPVLAPLLAGRRRQGL